jgi:hypothetical protein
MFDRASLAANAGKHFFARLRVLSAHIREVNTEQPTLTRVLEGCKAT